MSWLTSYLLHPALFWFLPLALVPILLHLLTLHRLKTVELSTFRFLFDSYVQQRRRMQFLEALLAMLRTAFLLGLVLAFCRPVVKHWSGLFKAGAGREVVLLVDCSASMNVATAGVPAFERAKVAARSVVERLGGDDKLTLVRCVSRPEEVFSRFSSDTEEIKNKIDDLKTSPARANFFAAVTQVFGPEAPPRKDPLVYVLTDCQASGWTEAKTQGLDRLLPAGAEVVVVNVGSNEDVANLAVVGDAPRRHRAVVGLPVYLQPRVVNYSKTEMADVTVTVFIDEKEVARVKMTLKPGEKGARTVIYEPTEPGVHRGRFEIAGKAADRFPEDDSYRFTLTVVPKIKVLVVNGNPAVTDPYESEALYLRAALTIDPEEAKDDKKPPAKDKALVRSLDPQEIAEGTLTEESLRDASVVILANCGALNPTHFTLLHNFVAAGGGLLVLPGDRVTNLESYNNFLFTVPGTVKQEITDARLGPVVGDPAKPETAERLAVIDYAHPALAVFDDPGARYFATVQFRQRFALTLPEKRGNAWSLAEFSNGAAALIESRFGDGLVALAAFPANAKWSNLPLKPEFVPLLLRLVTHLLHRPEVEGPSVVPADGTAEFRVTAAWAPAGGAVTDAAGRSQALTFERSGNRFVAAYDKTAEFGYYTAEVKGARPDQVRDVSFAVNLAGEESDFAFLGENQFRDVLPGVKLTFIDASAQAQQDLGAVGNAPSEVWPYLIYLVFFIITVEFLLATFGGRKKTAEEENTTVGERIRALSPGSWVGRMTGAGAKEGE